MNNIPMDGPAGSRLRSAIEDVQAGLIESVAGLDAMIASLTARRAEVVHQAHRWAQVTVDRVVPVGQPPRRRAELAERSFVAEIACALRMSERSAQKLIAESDTLVTTLPASFSALSEGRIGYAHARVIVDEAYRLDADARRSLEDTVIDAAATLTPARLRQRVRRVRERLHPETINTRLKAAVADRSVSVETAADGMAWLNLYGQAPLIAGIDDRVGQAAAVMKKHGDPRTITQLRADIATMLLLGDGSGIPCTQAGANAGTDTNADTDADADADTDMDTIADTDANAVMGMNADAHANVDADTDADVNATAGDNDADDNRVVPAAFTRQHPPGDAMGPLAVLLGQVRPQLDVSVPVLTLLGHSQTPGTLDGVIPIDADTARRLAAAAPSFTRILTDPETGVVLSVGRKRYRPPPDLARYIRLRDGTCRFPGCNRRARHTQIDHTIQRQDGGPTQWDNLACLCEKHHHLKDETVWKVVQLDRGIMQWTSPAGRIYTTEPETQLPAPDTHEYGIADVEEGGDALPRDATEHDEQPLF
jgi:hypothetical protein